MQRRFGRAGRRFNGGVRPSRTWADVSVAFLLNETVDAATKLIELQTPASLSLTADPPEDLTVLRIRGQFQVTLSTTSQWNLGLLVQDTNWTIGTTLAGDADKRLLWTRTYLATSAVAYVWNPDGSLRRDAGGAGDVTIGLGSEYGTLDIAPKVKIQPGQALYLAAWEETGAATLTVSSTNMRVLFQRTGRVR